MVRYRGIESDLDKHLFLGALMDRNETLFYRILMENIKDMAPIVYTPTVGQACIKFGQIYRRPRGMYFSREDIGQMTTMVYNWDSDDVDVIVVTDGSRILGLGDLGVHGMAIPIGKLALYVSAGGIHPRKVLPVTIDVGTNNPKLLNDSLYLGLADRRLEGAEYARVIDEFMYAVYQRWPDVLVQFEDFSNNNALPLLNKYRDRFLCFNDDIQGTGSVALAGVLSSLKAQGLKAHDIVNQRIVCLGAGSAGLGVVNSIYQGMILEGMTHEEAKNNFWLVDHEGLLGTKRLESLSSQQKQFCREDIDENLSLLEVVKRVKPTILLGLSGAARTFTQDVVQEMAKHVERPIIFPMSNPTSLAECTAKEAFEWTNGKCLFASGSPFDPVQINGKTFYTSQGNNMYIFPGIGLGAVVSKATKITDSMFYAASQTLATTVSEEELARGQVYPDITQIREVSKRIAVEVCKIAIKEKLARVELPDNLEDLQDFVEQSMYTPYYAPLVTTV
eukprot:TRINITY_DN4528_c0_g1_i2.p1 TRINITY_DN4528_c0_g1~~TRINITY_DN4528_c0_g1_i2.p1  ORF type:complete len:504 (+),score=105.86 TRINITY_DN4528_c0_g1_i2:239-1750(+)